MKQQKNADGSYSLEVADSNLWGTSAYAANALVHYVQPGTLSGSAGSGDTATGSGNGGTTDPGTKSGSSDASMTLKSFFSGIETEALSAARTSWGHIVILVVVAYFAWKFGHKLLKAI